MWQRLEDRLDRLGLALMDPRAGWAARVALAAAVLVAGWVLVPNPDGRVTLFGAPLPPCAVLETTGLPCSQCGMTRSWIWAARGHFGRAWACNPSGFVAWAALMAVGLVGGARWIRRDPSLLRVRGSTVALAGVAWWGFHLVTFALRREGWNPLP